MPNVRKIIKIDEEKCNGCGLCVPACAEGAIQIIDGKARLVSETYCDGLGACLGDCPQGAISMEERPAEAYDEAAVERHLASKKAAPATEKLACGCPGSAMRSLNHSRPAPRAATPTGTEMPTSQLGHWPVQLMLVPPHAPFLQGADLLICADCVPFTVPDFHERYLQGRAVVVGCPKLDDLDHYRGKLQEILFAANPASITVLRMEVPCCSGIANAVVEARDVVAPHLPVAVHTIGIQGGIRQETK